MEPATGLAETEARFRDAWSSTPEDPDGAVALLPERLTQAILVVLPVDGAGISLFSQQFRIPLAATGSHARAAELLQFTLGEGPCLSAANHHAIVVADLAQLSARWPVYADELQSQTPYRAVVSLPMAMESVSGAIDLFLEDSHGLGQLGLADAAVVADTVGRALTENARDEPPSPIDAVGPPGAGWMTSAPAGDRFVVWIAIGMLMATSDLLAADGLALLRSYAYLRSRTVDDVAADVASGQLDPAVLMG